MNNNLYSLSQIKKAFWAEFHEAGEVWFNYVGTPEENKQSTESHWESFLEALEHPLEPDVHSPDPAEGPRTT